MNSVPRPLNKGLHRGNVISLAGERGRGKSGLSRACKFRILLVTFPRPEDLIQGMLAIFERDVAANKTLAAPSLGI